jgi:hypothetical protein
MCLKLIGVGVVSARVLRYLNVSEAGPTGIACSGAVVPKDAMVLGLACV